MKNPLPLLALAAASALAAPPTPARAAPPAAAASPSARMPAYVDGRLVRPADYRQWIYLTTGFDMSYNPTLRADHHMFDNVFVDPGSWRAFQQTGTWPEGTTMVLEARGALDKGSINRQGHYQDADIMALEVHVKDSTRFAGGWAFFVFDDASREATMIPEKADCYACHKSHAAVDTTFVQFYPTLLPLAEARGTLSAAYLAEKAAPAGLRSRD
jgi:hypothetical protein